MAVANKNKNQVYDVAKPRRYHSGSADAFGARSKNEMEKRARSRTTIGATAESMTSDWMIVRSRVRKAENWRPLISETENDSGLAGPLDRRKRWRHAVEQGQFNIVDYNYLGRGKLGDPSLQFGNCPQLQFKLVFLTVMRVSMVLMDGWGYAYSSNFNRCSQSSPVKT